MKKTTPFIVAEISANHNGSFSKLKKLIDNAKINGADAIKIQRLFNRIKKILKLRKVYGKIILIGIYIKRQKLPTSGIEKYLNMQRKKRLFVLAHLLILKQWIF